MQVPYAAALQDAIRQPQGCVAGPRPVGLPYGNCMHAGARRLASRPQAMPCNSVLLLFGRSSKTLGFPTTTARRHSNKLTVCGG